MQDQPKPIPLRQSQRSELNNQKIHNISSNNVQQLANMYTKCVERQKLLFAAD